MKNKYSLLLLFASFCCLTLQCKKENEFAKLPDPSKTGAGIFACQLNGNAWPIQQNGEHNLYFNYALGFLVIHYDVLIGQNKMESINIVTNKVTEVGSYKVDYNGNSDNQFSVRYNDINFFSLDKINEKGFALINISRFDTIQHILSGTFSFSLMDRWGTSVMQVTNGRFDLPY